jgi:GNAT superfamily N-acetyltransferase
MDIRTVSGNAISPWLDALAELRIQVFRDFPYLYDGSADYERDYLAGYAESPASIFVLVFDGERVVGCATGLPLAEAHAEFRQPFEQAGMAVSDIFYFGESVLDRNYRGQGLGHVFFDRREDHARRLGFRFTTFCAVEREADHPLRPADYRPLHDFWRKRGYQPVAGLTAEFSWKDINQPHETAKRMQYWSRDHRESLQT